MRYTKKEHEEWLDGVGIADEDRRSNGGRIPDDTRRFGAWLRRNDPVAFNVSFQEREREMGFHEEWLDEVGVPDEDLVSNGGRIPDGARLGRWMRKNDPVGFNVSFQEREREMGFHAEQERSR